MKLRHSSYFATILFGLLCFARFSCGQHMHSNLTTYGINSRFVSSSDFSFAYLSTVPKVNWSPVNESIFLNHFLWCNTSHVKNGKCNGPNDPCFFLPEGHDNKKRFNPNMKNFLRILPRHRCNSRTKLLVGVLSRPCEIETRKFIRETWGHSKNFGKKTKRIFLIGFDGGNEYLNYKVLEESKKFGDILLINMIESYSNLTVKMFGFLNYAYIHCPRIKCVLKADSDTTLDILALEELCEFVPEVNYTIYGTVKYGTPVSRDGGKWHVPLYVYPDEYYPAYANGPLYMLTGYGILPRILNAWKTKTNWTVSENLRRISEDATITGYVREAAELELYDNFPWPCYGCNVTVDYLDDRWCNPKTKVKKILGFENASANRKDAFVAVQTINARQDTC